MVAEKTDRQRGHKPFGKAPQTLSTVGRKLAGRGQRVRWNPQSQHAEIVSRRVSTPPWLINVIEENPMNAMTQPIELALDQTGVPRVT